MWCVVFFMLDPHHCETASSLLSVGTWYVGTNIIGDDLIIFQECTDVIFYDMYDEQDE